MRYRNRLLIILALVAALAAVQGTATLGAATGRYISVEIEVFAPWGFLGLGTWQPLSESLQRYSTFSLPAEEANAVGEAVVRIASVNPSAWPQVLLSGDPRGHAWVYGINPELGTAYRLRVINNTPARVGVVVEIDGLNTLGSDWIAQTSDDRMWILAPQGAMVISGWQVSSQEALEFRFGVPSHTHSPLIERRGQITAYAYLEAERAGERATEAGAVIDQPVRYVDFSPLTERAVETISIRYGAGNAYLGVGCSETSGTGIRVDSVDPGSPAELYGLRPDDVITYVNTVPVSSCQQLSDLLAARHSGDRIVLKLHREGQSFLVAVELGD
ncbi:PDZ domain-containing protein [Candidatus Bipolaricaulota bacterium]|nr:PDZ domain-containing protein [Candidatus Bipolaricaulota bacterium]